MLRPHLSDILPLTWEEIYSDWKSEELKYYWRSMEYREVPRYMGYLKKGLQEAVDLARRRDPRAVLALRRVIRLDPTSEDAQTARTALEAIGAES